MTVTVLLADDADDIRLLTRTMLELDGGFSVVGEAVTGTDAVTLTERLQPELIVLDLAMPELDGLQALPLMRKASPASRVVVLSGFEQQTFGDKVIALGASRYVQKGRSLRELVDVLRDVSGLEPAPVATIEQQHGDSDFVAMVVHDLRSPLTAIRGAADVLKAAEDRLDRR